MSLPRYSHAYPYAPNKIATKPLRRQRFATAVAFFRPPFIKSNAFEKVLVTNSNGLSKLLELRHPPGIDAGYLKKVLSSDLCSAAQSAFADSHAQLLAHAFAARGPIVPRDCPRAHKRWRAQRIVHPPLRL